MFYCVVTRKLNSLDISDMLQNTVNSDLWGKSSELGDEFMLHLMHQIFKNTDLL